MRLGGIASGGVPHSCPLLCDSSGNAVLHAFSRSPPSRAGVYARASARIPVAEQGGVWDLELGKAVERVRVSRRPRLPFLRNRPVGPLYSESLRGRPTSSL